MVSWGRSLRDTRSVLSLGFVLFGVAVLSGSPLCAQENLDGASGEESIIRTFPGGEPWPKEFVRLDEGLNSPALPAPPESRASTLTNGRVKFHFYDAKKFSRRYQGETQFIARYSNDVTYRWKVRRDRTGVYRLSIYPEFDKIELNIEHEVLLPVELAGDNFYSHPLVLHELDHVRISSDPRFAKAFSGWIKKELREIVIEVVPPADGNYREIAVGEVRRRTEALFQRLLQLIKVRYQELDRETKHGTLSLPDDFFSEDKVVSP